eukprot:TRINITY_DN20442_c0_g1_i1.p1 TRINITY_DN20442_c0_g1~~TRINITY_DN20442_c0_g1_i1.p1  ORF type:complete len:322 (+),score=62.02 TRINITY_DN20442_c0_g1_i1:81-1046(+)
MQLLSQGTTLPSQLLVSRMWASNVLTHTCAANSACDDDDTHSCFFSKHQPQSPIVYYMQQLELAAGGKVWPMCLILMDELSREAVIPVTKRTVHRLLVTAYSIALKMSVDKAGLSRTVALAAGLEVRDLIAMENTFLEILDWRVIVNPAAHQKFWDNRRLIQEISQRAASKQPLSGAITMIPGAVLPRHERLGLGRPAVYCPPAMAQPTPPAMPFQAVPRPFCRRTGLTSSSLPSTSRSSSSTESLASSVSTSSIGPSSSPATSVSERDTSFTRATGGHCRSPGHHVAHVPQPPKKANTFSSRPLRTPFPSCPDAGDLTGD